MHNLLKLLSKLLLPAVFVLSLSGVSQEDMIGETDHTLEHTMHYDSPDLENLLQPGLVSLSVPVLFVPHFEPGLLLLALRKSFFCAHYQRIRDSVSSHKYSFELAILFPFHEFG